MRGSHQPHFEGAPSDTPFELPKESLQGQVRRRQGTPPWLEWVPVNPISVAALRSHLDPPSRPSRGVRGTVIFHQLEQRRE